MPDRKQQRQTSDFAFLGAAALCLVLMTTLFAGLLPKSKGIAYWAKENRKKSWALIGLGHIVLGFGGSTIGRVLYQLGHESTEVTTWVLTGTAALSFLVYPDRQNSNRWLPYSFRTSKLLSFILALSGFLLFVNIGNRNAADKSFSPVSTKMEKWLNFDQAITKPISEFIITTQHAFAQDVPNDSLANLLFLLMVAGIFALAVGVAGLACHVSCSGGGTAGAVIVAATGAPLVVLFAIVTFREIQRGADRRAAKRKEEASENIPKQKPKSFDEKYKWF